MTEKRKEYRVRCDYGILGITPNKKEAVKIAKRALKNPQSRIVEVKVDTPERPYLGSLHNPVITVVLIEREDYTCGFDWKPFMTATRHGFVSHGEHGPLAPTE